MLRSCITMVYFSKLRNYINTLLLMKLQTFFGIFPDFSTNVLFCSRTQSKSSHLSPSFHLFCDNLCLFVCLLLPLYFWRVLVRYFIDWSLVWVCLIYSHNYTGIIEEKLPFPSHHIGGKWYQVTLLVMLTWITWLRWHLPGFSTVFSAFHTLFIGTESYSSGETYKVWGLVNVRL